MNWNCGHEVTEATFTPSGCALCSRPMKGMAPTTLERFALIDAWPRAGQKMLPESQSKGTLYEHADFKWVRAADVEPLIKLRADIEAKVKYWRGLVDRFNENIRRFAGRGQPVDLLVEARDTLEACADELIALLPAEKAEGSR